MVLALAGVARAQDDALPQAPTPAEDAKPAQAGGDSSSSQSSDRQKAAQQVKDEEHQRILGVLPNFGTTYVSDAASLTVGQKMSLALRSAVDPATFGIAALVAGYHEANDDYSGFGWGAQGFGKRWGAAYLDAFDGAIIGNGILPAVFHQDPRYFRLGHGTTTHRLLYAAMTTVMCKHDNSARWEPNYSNVGGNIIAGAISNYYYPSQQSGWGQTIESGMIVTLEGTGGGIFNEFWPDISRKLFHKDPTHGLDAQARARDAADKAARKKDKEKQPIGAGPK